MVPSGARSEVLVLAAEFLNTGIDSVMVTQTSSFQVETTSLSIIIMMQCNELKTSASKAINVFTSVFTIMKIEELQSRCECRRGSQENLIKCGNSPALGPRPHTCQQNKQHIALLVLLVIGGRAFAITTYVHLIYATASTTVAALIQGTNTALNGIRRTETPLVTALR